MKMKRFLLIIALYGLSSLAGLTRAENGYELWLRYQPIEDAAYLEKARAQVRDIALSGNTGTTEVLRGELENALKGLLDLDARFSPSLTGKESLLILKQEDLAGQLPRKDRVLTTELPGDAYLIHQDPKTGRLYITASTDLGLLYGTFHFLRLLQTQSLLADIHILEVPETELRLLNHWDNLDRTVERGYAGFSIWDWHKLPDYIDQRYVDYARACASVGINGTVLTNVNANSLVLKSQYIEKVKALADVFRPYGVKVYLTARFSAPRELGGLQTADPLNEEVQEWWKMKADEIYAAIPDFGGFLVKANSEGQPGPQDYDRSHAEGANMLARAVAPHRGVVMWRAFVYSHEVPEDRAKQAYNEFMPLDGKFDDNVLVQVKNGPVDFMPREPFHPLFGAMQQTPLMMEFQITQEYLGCATHLVYLGPLYEEVLDADTYGRGKGSFVAEAVDGMAGVSNIGNDINWTGHPFAQANWYAYGRLAWDHELSSEAIAEEWLRMTFSNQDAFLELTKPMMMQSREAAVNYMNPLGLHHQMAENHHWGPGPWVDGGRPDWTSVYYSRADSFGLGFDRSSTGSGATQQYFPEVRELFDEPSSCPEELLLWFHHVSWDHELSSGRTLWNELAFRFNSGVEAVRGMQADWGKSAPYVDEQRHRQVEQLLAIQEQEARWWREVMLLYLQQFSNQPIPAEYEQPEHDLEYWKNKKYYYVPGIFNQKVVF